MVGGITPESSRTSPILDFLEPEYGGGGVGDVLVFTPGKAEFYGRGAVVKALAHRDGCWFGGALPERGFWGMPLMGATARRCVESEILTLLRP